MNSSRSHTLQSLLLLVVKLFLTTSVARIAPGTATSKQDQKATTTLRFPSRSVVRWGMRCAFVVRLGPETKPSEGRFEGWVEEVDTGKELRFGSDDELLKFLGDRFEAVRAIEPDGGKPPWAGLKDADET